MFVFAAPLVLPSDAVDLPPRVSVTELLTSKLVVAVVLTRVAWASEGTAARALRVARTATFREVFSICVSFR